MLVVRLRFVVRIILVLTALLLLPVIGSAVFVRGGGLAGTALAMIGVLWLWLWLPRLAHSAFDSGKYAVAARRYAWLERLASSRTRERAARLSRAGATSRPAMRHEPRR